MMRKFHMSLLLLIISLIGFGQADVRGNPSAAAKRFNEALEAEQRRRENEKLQNTEYTSCQDFWDGLGEARKAISYTVTLDGGFKGECDFRGSGYGVRFFTTGGWLRIARNPNKLEALLSANNITTSKVIIRYIDPVNKNQRETIIEQIDEYADTPLGIQASSYDGYERVHYNVDEYIFLGIVPKDKFSNGEKQGYKANGVEYSFTNCNSDLHSQFSFYPAMARKKRSVAEERGRDVEGKWQIGSTEATKKYSSDDFFMPMIERFGGCGAKAKTAEAMLGLVFTYVE